MKKLLFSSLYSLSIPIIYLHYLNPTWEYAGYNIYRNDIFIFLIFFMTIIPIFFLHRLSISSVVNFFVYILVYVPGLYISYYNIKNISYLDLIVLDLSLTFIITLGFMVSNRIYSLRFIKNLKIDNFFAIVGVIMMISVFFSYKDRIQLVNFEEIYNLRRENTEIGLGFIGYLTMWLTYFFIPFYLANASDNKKIFLTKLFYYMLAFFASIIIYGSTGAKIVIFLLITIIWINYIIKYHQKFYQNLLLGILVLNIIIFLLPNTGIFFWIKSIYFLRTLTIGGWTISVYYDYFMENNYTYYSHITFINKLIDFYPYGELGLGQLIGIEISGSPLANFNANFFATDGIAAAGIFGIFLVGIVYTIFIFFLDCLSNMRSFDILKKQILVSIGFIFSLTNLSLFTSILSGGGLLLFIYLMFSKKESNYEGRSY